MPNIKFSYLYRDGSNYKKYDFVIFANPDNVNLTELESLIKSKLIYDEWFYATEWNLPEFFTDYCDFRVDPTWHEFENLEHTDEDINTGSLSDFIDLIRQTNWPF